MELKIIELTDTYARFVVSGTRPDMANALRRCLMMEVPKMAIDTVEFHLGPIRDEEGREFESVSPLFDEIIAHRLGLVPIPTEPDLYTYKDQCSCEGEGCPSCTIIYSLNKKGPGDVYSGDLEPLGSQELRIRDDLIPIVKLGPGQAILAYASAELGPAKRHVKWQVTSAPTTVTIRTPLTPISAGATLLRSLSSPRPGIKDGKPVVEDLEACMLCKSCGSL